MNWFSHGANGKKFLIVGIASDSIGAGVVAVSPDTQPILLCTMREPISFAPTLEPSHFFSATLHALGALCGHMFQTHGHDLAGVDRVHIFLHAPWVVSKTRPVRVDFPSPTILTSDALASVIQEAEKGIADNFRAAHRDIAEAVRVVEKKITEFRVNGYGVTSAVGKEARTLELTLLESFAPDTAIARFGNTLATLSPAPLEWHGAASACAGALAASLHGEGDALVICAGSEATEVCIERAGVLHEVISVPFGIRTGARAAWSEGAFASGISAESFLRATLFGSLAEKRRAEVEEARDAATARFKRAVAGVLLPKIKSGFAPAPATILADERSRLFFERALRTPLFEGADAERSPSFAVRGVDAFSESLTLAGAAAPDTYLMGEAVFVGLYENGKKL